MSWEKITNKLGLVGRRLDKICADLNIILLVFAIGLAILYITVFCSNAIRDALILRVNVQMQTKTVHPTYRPNTFRPETLY